MTKIEAVEQFKVMLLNKRNDCLGVSDISLGGIAGCIVDAKIIFAIAIKALATNVILAHNHPSGFLEPSATDMLLTHKLHQGGKLLDIVIMDHLIISPHGYYSMADEGMMPG